MDRETALRKFVEALATDLHANHQNDTGARDEAVRSGLSDEDIEATLKVVRDMLIRRQRSIANIVTGRTAWRAPHCPKCGARQRDLHPVSAITGLVDQCPDPWHSRQ